MFQDLRKLESERAYLIEMLREREQRSQWMMYLAIPIVLTIAALLVGAVIADQLSVHALVGSAIFVIGLMYVLGRNIFRNNEKVASALDVLSGTFDVDVRYVRERIAEYDRSIEELKSGRKA
jgi:undecaprenyl pyrophosphate phosphatase UppP